MSNLTSASNDASISSGNRIEVGAMYPQQPLASSQSNQTQQPPAKKINRKLPGNPDPEAEVIALSPSTLLATNRFVCEICNKGFQREQNLQLHRRSHNLPWKLKQRTNKEVIRKKVYLCPETTCVHHDPSRALGDLTGIKKHFSRKHGEKKWKCEKCSKRYAVRSDWRAHSKICGTREYRCDCGTLFSRRDSFITHRAFCDALAEESARAISSNPLNILSSQSAGGSSSPTIQLHLQYPLQGGHGRGGLPTFPLKREQDHRHNHLQQSFNLIRPPEMPPWLATGTHYSGPTTSHHDLFNSRATSSLDQSMTMSLHQENLNINPNQEFSSFAAAAMTASPHMSATALLQKAAQMGVTMSPPCQSAETKTTTLIRPHQAHMMSTATRIMSSTSLATSSSVNTAGSSLGLSSREEMGAFIHPGLEASFGNKAVITTGCMEQVVAGPSTCDQHGGLMGVMSSFASSSQINHGFEGSSSFGSSDNFPGIFLNAKKDNEINFQERMHKPGGSSSKEGGVGGRGGINDGLTRDFLGLRAFPHREFLNLDDLHRIGSSYQQQQQQQNQNPAPWQS